MRGGGLAGCHLWICVIGVVFSFSFSCMGMWVVCLVVQRISCWVGNSGEKDPGLYGPCYRMLCDCCNMWWCGVGMVAQV